jgi:hypothetical protein
MGVASDSSSFSMCHVTPVQVTAAARLCQRADALLAFALPVGEGKGRGEGRGRGEGKGRGYGNEEGVLVSVYKICTKCLNGHVQWGTGSYLLTHALREVMVWWRLEHTDIYTRTHAHTQHRRCQEIVCDFDGGAWDVHLRVQRGCVDHCQQGLGASNSRLSGDSSTCSKAKEHVIRMCDLCVCVSN